MKIAPFITSYKGACVGRSIILNCFLAAIVAILCSCDKKTLEVKGSAMSPTYVDGDKVNVIFKKATYARGDVIVIESPVDSGSHWMLRIVGLPGEKLEWRDGGIYINGNMFDLSVFGISDKQTNAVTLNSMEILLAVDEFYLLGDNLSNARDSREFGAFHSEAFVGKVAP